MSEFEQRVESCYEALLASCREANVWISGDHRVGEEAAGMLLGLSPQTLANQRSAGTAPPHYRLGGGGHRVTYGLQDLAVFIVNRRSG